MKRNMDLIRELMLALEANTDEPLGWVEIDLPEYDPKLVSYHVQLLDDAGFIEAKGVSSSSGYCWLPTRLTFYGHEFLDTIRDPEIWSKTQTGIQKLGSVGIEIVKDIALAYAKQKASALLGIAL